MQDRTPELRAVRFGSHRTFDRVVWEWRGDAPPHTVAFVQPREVVQCGSGDQVPVTGAALLQVRFVGARAHDDRGRVLVSRRERRFGYPVLREAEGICDFEGQVEWVLGLSRRVAPRVHRLSNPARLVIDLPR